MGFLAQQNLQQMSQTFFGLDPFMVMGLLTVAFAGVGWLTGPLVGSAVFRAMYRRQAEEMALVSFRRFSFVFFFFSPCFLVYSFSCDVAVEGVNVYNLKRRKQLCNMQET